MKRSLRAGLAHSLSIVALLAAAAPPAASQCMPDGINGACCAPVNPTLPGFPSISMSGATVCWNGCGPSAPLGATVSWTTPVQVSCTEYVTTLGVVDTGTGLPVFTGTMVLDYTRTWEEIDPAGNLHQVWRFVAKADLSIVPVGVVWPCQAPNCIVPLGPHPTAFYYGYVDYSLQCAPGAQFRNSLVLHHACDFFIHKPGLSDKPGVFHPFNSFAIVAPHSTAQPFLPSRVPAPGGPMFGEGTRDIGSFVPPLCFDEDPLANGTATPLGGFCFTTFSPFMKQHTVRQFVGQGACVGPTGVNGAFQSLNISFPTLPWFHLTAASMGTWTNNNVWPGKEHAWAEEGIFVHRGACTGDWVDINYGATTSGGWMINHPVLLRTMTDLADNYTVPITGPFSLPAVGSLRPTEKLIYVNTP